MRRMGSGSAWGAEGADRKRLKSLPRDERGKSKILNHRGHPFDSPFASSGSLRAGYGTQRRVGRAKGLPLINTDNTDRKGQVLKATAEGGCATRASMIGKPRAKVEGLKA